MIAPPPHDQAATLEGGRRARQLGRPVMAKLARAAFNIRRAVKIKQPWWAQHAALAHKVRFPGIINLLLRLLLLGGLLIVVVEIVSVFGTSFVTVLVFTGPDRG